MTSERQIQANRRNARRSTGPKSAAGKAVSSRNAVKHGLCARRVVIEGERAEEFAALRDELYMELKPAGALEHMLVERASALIWRLRRVPELEAAVLRWLQSRRAARNGATGIRLGGVYLSATPETEWEKRTGLGAKDAAAQKAVGRTLAAALREDDLLNRLGRYERELARQLESTLRALSATHPGLGVRRLLPPEA